MRLLVHDPAADGHHPVMLRELVRALAARHEVVVAARPALLARVGTLGGEVVALPEAAARGARADLDAFDAVTTRVRPDHRLHAYATRPVLGAWATRRPGDVPTSALVISPAALHYPRAYDTALTPGEWGNALVKEALVERLRRRSDTHAVLTMDPVAADRWRRRGGGPVLALPEPPVRDVPPPPGGRRDGVVLLGALSARKGFEHVVRALQHDASGVRLVLAGQVQAGYAAALADGVARLQAAGVIVDLHRGWLGDDELLTLLASARAALVPYVGHKGTSRIVLEAAAVGTPVIAHDEGLVGAQVRRHGLGETVDARDPEALRAAITAACRTTVTDRRAALRAFAARSSPEAFAAAACAAFEGAPATFQG